MVAASASAIASNLGNWRALQQEPLLGSAGCLGHDNRKNIVSNRDPSGYRLLCRGIDAVVRPVKQVCLPPIPYIYVSIYIHIYSPAM